MGEYLLKLGENERKFVKVGKKLEKMGENLEFYLGCEKMSENGR